jgi:transcriptional antiterminator RfaH
MTSTGNRSWYVVQTHSHCEGRAVQHLARQGFETYFPRYLKRRRHARRIDVVVAPLFPGYLFVAIDRSIQRWRSIQSTIGVVRLLCNGDAPCEVPPAILNEIRRQESSDGYVALRSMPAFNPGDAIRIVDGAFAECLGLFDQMRDRERVSVLLNLLGRKVRLTLSAENIAAA